MSKIIVFIKSNPIFISLFIGVVSISTAVTAVLLPGAQGEPGKEVEFRVTDEAIEYRYDGDSTYTTLIDLDDLIGPMGMNGKDVFFDINETHILWRYHDQTTWIQLISIESLKGLTGNPGKSVMIDTTSSHIVWRYEQDETWQNLIDLDLLKGQDGREVEFQTSETHIQWRYVGASTWTDLLSLSIIKGTSGQEGREVEFQTSETHIQWRYVDSSTWSDLLAISLLKGANGQDGREVEFQTSETHIQWRYVGDETYTNLFLLELLKGEPGDNGLPGLDGKEVEFQTDGTILQWRYIGETLWMNVYDFSNLAGVDGVSLNTIELNETGSTSYVLFDSMRYAEETEVIMMHEFQRIPDTFNPNADIYYSGYGTDGANNNPETGNTYGYEIYIIDGVLTTDLHFGITYFDDDEILDQTIEIRVTYDLNIEDWVPQVLQQESYFLSTYDQRYFIEIDTFSPYQNQNVVIPKGSSNVFVEMYVLSDITNDYDFAYFILGDRVDESLNNNQTFYGFTLPPSFYDIEYVFDVTSDSDLFQDNSIDTYYVITTSEAIIYVGGTDTSGTLEDLGIGVGTYRFFSISDDVTEDRLIIDGVLEEAIYVYVVADPELDWEIDVEDLADINNENTFTWIDHDHLNVYGETSRYLTFELTDSTVFEFDLSDLIGADVELRLDSLYDLIMSEFESRLPMIVIENAEDFQAMNQCLQCDYILKNNIDLDDLEQFISIGTENRPFTGSLDGNGFVIENVPSQSGDTENPYALFAYALNASFKNLTIINEFYAATSSSGLIVGQSFGEEDIRINFLSFENIRIYIFDLSLNDKSGLLVGDALNIEIILNDIQINIYYFTIDDFSGIFIGQIEEVILDARHVQLTVDYSIFFTMSSGFIGYTLNSEVSMYHSEFFLPTIDSDGRDIAVMFAWVDDSEVTLINTYLDFSLTGELYNYLQGDASVGGIFGTLTQSTAIINGLSLGIYSKARIMNVQSQVGMIAGYVEASLLNVSHVNGYVEINSGVERIGSLIGFSSGNIQSKSEIIFSNIQLVIEIDTSAQEVGGLVGAIYHTDIKMYHIALTGEMNLYGPTSSHIGGILGRVYYGLLQSPNEGSFVFIDKVNLALEISKSGGGENVGGFIGLVEGPLYDRTTSQFTFDNTVTTNITSVEIRSSTSNSILYVAANYYGGFIGYVSGGEVELINVVSSGEVYSTTHDYGGGFIGYVDHSEVLINLGKSIGVLFGNEYLGGFFGYVEGPSFINTFTFTPSLSELIEIYSFSNSIHIFDIYGGKDVNAFVSISDIKQRTEGIDNNS
jgi:hypothetical protein